MSPKAQRIAVAETCGWKRSDVWIDGPSYEDSIPDYLNDLNAMHEAEGSLSWKDEGPATSSRRRYLMNLEAVISGPADRFGYRQDRVLSVPFATAAQRAEAFLKTINKWDDSK